MERQSAWLRSKGPDFMLMPFLEITSKRFSENSPWAPSGVYSVHSLSRPDFTLTPLVKKKVSPKLGTDHWLLLLFFLFVLMRSLNKLVVRLGLTRLGRTELDTQRHCFSLATAPIDALVDDRLPGLGALPPVA